jgi:elongation factor Ts
LEGHEKLMEVTTTSVKELREKTGAGIMDCKKALAECEGDQEKAVDYLRRKGLAAAAKKASQVASEGLVGAYIHPGGKIGVLVELNCVTDFVARTPEFQALLKDVAMQIAAANPRYVRPEDVPPEEIEREREIYRRQALDSGKPEKVAEKIVEGKMERFYSEFCLMEQAFIKDPDRKLGDLIGETVARLQENIQVRRFVRYHLGEGVEK